MADASKNKDTKKVASAEPLIPLIGVDPEYAFRSFFKDPEWGRKSALGATFNALSVLLITFKLMLLPIVFLLWAVVAGYQMRVMRLKMADPDAKLPDWNDWVDLLISGLTWLAVYTGFFFFILSIPTISTIIGAAQGAMYAPDPRFLTWSTTTYTLTFVLSIFVGIITTFLQANLAQQEKTTAAFELFKVTRRLRKSGGPMLQAWLLSVGLMAAAIILPICTVIGVFLMPTTMFIAGTISATMVAQAWTYAEDADKKPAPKTS